MFDNNRIILRGLTPEQDYSCNVQCSLQASSSKLSCLSRFRDKLSIMSCKRDRNNCNTELIRHTFLYMQRITAIGAFSFYTVYIKCLIYLFYLINLTDLVDIVEKIPSQFSHQ